MIRRWVQWVAGGVVALCIVGFLYVTVVTAWRIAQVHSDSAERLIAQSELLLNTFGFVLTTALVGATLWYAVLTRRLALEATRSREASERYWREQREREDQARVAGAVAALVGAAADVVIIGSHLSVLLEARRVWRVRAADPLTAAVAGVLRAAETVRFLEPGLSSEVDEMMDAVAEYQSAATRRDGAHLEGVAVRIADARRALSDAVRALAIPSG